MLHVIYNSYNSNTTSLCESCISVCAARVQSTHEVVYNAIVQYQRNVGDTINA